MKLRLLEVAQKKAAELAANMEAAHREQVAEMREALARKRRGGGTQPKDAVDQPPAARRLQEGNGDSTIRRDSPSAQVAPAPQQGTVARCRKEVEELLLQSEKKAPPTLELREEPRKVDVEAAEPEAQWQRLRLRRKPQRLKLMWAGCFGWSLKPMATLMPQLEPRSTACLSCFAKKLSALQRSSQDDRLGDAPIFVGMQGARCRDRARGGAG